jgi:hypothetical protein
MRTLAQISGENNPFFSKKEFAKLLPLLGSVSPQVGLQPTVLMMDTVHWMPIIIQLWMNLN